MTTAEKENFCLDYNSMLEDVSIAAFSFIDSRFSTFYQIIHQFVTQVEYWYLKVTC